MLRAIELARKGEGRTNPNPLVGAVIVKNGKIIGEGYHRIYGDLHAEREALKNCAEGGENPEGAEIYVTLEPCCHFGKQPPCTQAILESGIKRVIVGSRDPNPLVHGKGNEFLRERGIEVYEDFLREKCDELNPVFFHYIQANTPFVALKFAMTLDGKIATKTGKSKWISNEKSREYVHHLRNKYTGILAGIGTVLSDDPLLNCRLLDDDGQKIGRDPIRIICDSNLRIPLDSQIVKTASEIKTIVACSSSSVSARENSEKAGEERQSFLQKKHFLESAGIEVIEVSPATNESLITSEETQSPLQKKLPQINLQVLMKILGEKKIDSILIEGGASINYAALESKIVNKIYAFIAPKIFGGSAKSPVGGLGVSCPDEAFSFNLQKVTHFDGDILLEYGKSGKD